jgi:hypothetical protein
MTAMATALMVAALVGACSQAPQAPVPVTGMPQVTIDAADFSYTAPETLNAGWVRVKLMNVGKEPHHVQFMRLNDGVTLQQFQEALKQGEGPALALVQLAGGVGAVDPSSAATAVINLPAGNYVIACFVTSADNVPHLAKGMIKPLTVTAATGATASEPTATTTVRLKDFAIDMPDTLPAGNSVIKVINDGPEFHEWNIFRLGEGKTAQDIFAWFGNPAGPPPFSAIGGLNGLSKNFVGYAELDLKPGTYLAICNIPSGANQGKPHSELGMLKQFTVK